VSGAECVPFKTAGGGSGRDGVVRGERWETGCVEDPASPLDQWCAVEVDQRSRPKRTALCAEPARSTEVTELRSGLVMFWFMCSARYARARPGAGGRALLLRLFA